MIRQNAILNKEQDLGNTFTFLKKGIWLYFFLLIFEGALRKWLLPGLSEPLLLIRDPLALWLIITAIHKNIWRPCNYVVIMIGVTLFSFIAVFLVGHGDIMVALFGLRITVIQFPLLFLIGNIFERKDVLKLGNIMLWLTIGMTLLVAVQFYSPQSSWVNLGVGGDISGSGFSGAAGFYRVPGTFSFTNGLALFYGLSAAFVLYFWMGDSNNKSKSYLLIAATIALLAAIPLSISRSILFQFILAVFFVIIISGNNFKIIKNIVIAGICVGMFIFALNQFDFFQTATVAFTERFTTASTAEGGLKGTLVDRFLGGMFATLYDPQISFWGAGLGMGSQVGSKLLTGTTGVYLISEGEWGRLLGEMGIILGFIAIFIRIILGFDLVRNSWNSVKEGNYLPWMLLSIGLVNILQGQWAQPTSLGFSVIIGGLILAAFKNYDCESYS